MDRYGHLIVFKDGRRIDKRVDRIHLQQAATKARSLRAKGIKAHLVYRTDTSLYPPPHQIEQMRDEGKLWCPYCRAWRYFTVPKFKPHAENNSFDWFMNTYHRQGIKVCQWCSISVVEWYVMRANGIFGEAQPIRRRRRKRRAK